MKIGTITSIQSHHASFLAGGGLSQLPPPSESDPDAVDPAESETSARLSRLIQQAEDAAEAAAIAAEGYEHLEDLSLGLQHLNELAEQYHDDSDEVSDADRLATDEEFSAARISLLELVDATIVAGKVFFEEGTSFTFRTAEAAAQTITLDAGLDRDLLAGLELTDDAAADMTSLRRATAHVDGVEQSYHAAAGRLESAAVATGYRLEQAEEDLTRHVNTDEAMQLLQTNLAEMLTNTSRSLLIQANVASGDALALLM